MAVDHDEGGRPSMLLQSTRSWISLRADAPFYETAPLFTIIDPASAQPIGFVPERVGTVHAASLRVSRWHLVLPENFSAPAAGIRLFAAPPPVSASQPSTLLPPHGLHP